MGKNKTKEVIGIKEKNHKYESIFVLVLYSCIYIYIYIYTVADIELNVLNLFCDYY